MIKLFLLLSKYVDCLMWPCLCVFVDLCIFESWCQLRLTTCVGFSADPSFGSRMLTWVSRICLQLVFSATCGGPHAPGSKMQAHGTRWALMLGLLATVQGAGVTDMLHISLYGKGSCGRRGQHNGRGRADGQ